MIYKWLHVFFKTYNVQGALVNTREIALLTNCSACEAFVVLCNDYEPCPECGDFIMEALEEETAEMADMALE